MKIKLLSAVAMSLLLTACMSSGPSEKDIRRIAMGEFDQMAVMASMFTSESELKQIRSVINKIKLKSCEKEKNAPAIFGEDVYSCDIELSDPSGSGAKETQNVLIAKIDKEWMAPRGIIQ